MQGREVGRPKIRAKWEHSEVEENYKYEEIKIGYLIKTNTDKPMERKGDKANMQKYSCNV